MTTNYPIHFLKRQKYRKSGYFSSDQTIVISFYHNNSVFHVHHQLIYYFAFYLLIPEPGPPTNIVLRQISNKRVQATWTPPAGFSGATYRVYINTMNVNTGGTEVTGTTHTTETITTSTVTIRVRATTGTYLSVPAVSDTLTVRGKKGFVISKFINTIFFVRYLLQ